MTLHILSCEYAPNSHAEFDGPEYCPCENEMPDPCPACGATVSGNDPVEGICQARNPSPRPDYSITIGLVRRGTGEFI